MLAQQISNAAKTFFHTLKRNSPGETVTMSQLHLNAEKLAYIRVLTTFINFNNYTRVLSLLTLSVLAV